ncbi:hypothetical protein [Labrenzia sp. OB1]|uniref:hypothetical protein n=1 Tax=Labrenzia sp. OB1 TaxID=1561204 RepID=UPI0007B212B5|nr:hypothetical protein [Labrenzia sp. OB1]KZM51194.1 hypothetical protein OA90_05940 [Labrenzia sp. OB1]
MLGTWLDFTYVFRDSASVLIIGTPEQFDYVLKFPGIARLIVRDGDDFLARFNKHLLMMTDAEIQKFKFATLEDGPLCVLEDDPKETVGRVARKIGLKFWAIELSQDLFDYLNHQYSLDAEAEKERLTTLDAGTGAAAGREDVGIFSLEEFGILALEKLKSSAQGEGPLPSLADTVAALKSEADRQDFFSKLGVGQKAKVKLVNGKLYVVITGRAGLRPLLPGIKFLPSNPKVAELGLALQDQVKNLKYGFKLNIIFTVPMELISTFFDDERQWRDLLGTFATTGIITVITQLIMWAIGLTTGLVIGTGLVASSSLIVGALVISGALAYIANELGLDRKINDALQRIPSLINKGWVKLGEKIEEAIMSKSDVPDRKLTLQLIEDSLKYNFFPDMLKYR